MTESEAKRKTDQDRLRDIADLLAKASFDGFVPTVVVKCYAIAYEGLADKRGFVKPFDGKT